MKPEGTVQYNSLSWVKKQLDAVLSDAQTSLSDYIEDSENTSALEQCIEHLRLVLLFHSLFLQLQFLQEKVFE